MRILFVSNYFPPVIHGGYEQLCREVAIELVERGHELGVLTGNATAATGKRMVTNVDGLRVYRCLQLEVVGGVASTAVRILRDRARLERSNEACVRGLLNDFQPDAVMVWGLWNVPRDVPVVLEECCCERLVYYVCDYWPLLPSAFVQQFEAPSRRAATGMLKRALGTVMLPRLRRNGRRALRMNRTFCVSRAARDLLVQAGAVPTSAGVIYGNARVEQFTDHRSRLAGQSNSSLRLLYSGRLDKEKGVETALRALSLLPASYLAQVQFDIVGAGVPHYERMLRHLVSVLDLEDHVQFLGSKPRDQIPSVLGMHDVLVFPSEWQEPFARSVLEAMSSGLMVIASNTGGTPEAVSDNRTGLLFPAGDAERLAAALARVVDEPEMRTRLAEAGRRLVAERFTFGQTVDALETALLLSVAERGTGTDLSEGRQLMGASLV